MSKIKKMREKHKSLMLIKMEREAFFSTFFVQVHAPLFSLKKDERLPDDTFFFSLSLLTLYPFKFTSLSS